MLVALVILNIIDGDFSSPSVLIKSEREGKQ